jgi:hypothetical protein
MVIARSGHPGEPVAGAPAEAAGAPGGESCASAPDALLEIML